MHQASLHTPLGELTLFAEAGALVALEWGRGMQRAPRAAALPLLAEASRQLHAYFDGQLSAFDLPLAPQGTAFQLRVWTALQTIPTGETRSYGDVARALSTAARAVGQANARNPLPILIPCHRVTGHGGLLGGYSGGDGLNTKTWLLQHELRMRLGANAPGQELIR